MTVFYDALIGVSPQGFNIFTSVFIFGKVGRIGYSLVVFNVERHCFQVKVIKRPGVKSVVARKAVSYTHLTLPTILLV